MPSDTRVKICGLKEHVHIAAAADAGARYIGFNFFAKSPRSVTVDQATSLMLEVPVGVAKVALVVDMDDAGIGEIVDKTTADMIQLHGKESPDRVAEVKNRFGLPVMKALGIAGPNDVAAIDIYSDVADQLLIDAKAPKGAELPGGNGLPFDWQLVNRKYWRLPWMLAGGLTVDNVGLAQQMTGARQVDVSSGVEIAPGEKETSLIQDFIKAALA